MRKHRNEIIRFANSESGTKVWFKYANMDWGKIKIPTWYEDNHAYIVDDEYASLRKESIDTGRPIQVKDSVTGKWVIPSYELEFTLPLENYRLKPEFNYPIYKKAKNNGSITKFTGRREGVVVEATKKSQSIGHFIGYKPVEWVEHTDTNVWEYGNINPTLFWDEVKFSIPKKPLPNLKIDTKVIVWNDEESVKYKAYLKSVNNDGKIVCFANGTTSFSSSGEVSEWDNYELVEDNTKKN